MQRQTDFSSVRVIFEVDQRYAACSHIARPRLSMYCDPGGEECSILGAFLRSSIREFGSLHAGRGENQYSAPLDLVN